MSVGPNPDPTRPYATEDEPEGVPGPGLIVVRPALGSMLVDEGLVTREQVEAAMEEGESGGERLGEVLLRHGWIGEAELAQTIARQWSLPYVAEEELVIDPRASLLISPEEAQEAGVYPLCFDEEHRTVVAVADPTEGRLDRLRTMLGGQVEFAVATVSALRRLHESNAPAPETAGDATPAADARGEQDGFLASAETPAGRAPEPGPPEPLLVDAPPPAAPQSPSEAEALLARLDSGAEALAGARAGLASLLEAYRTLGERAQAAERDLREALEARDDERARVAELEAGLAQREDFLAGLRSKLSELDGASR